MSQLLCDMKNIEVLEAPITLKSTLAPGQDQELEGLAKALAASVRGDEPVLVEDNETSKPKGFVCKVCGFIYEGDTLPDNFVCPICHRPARDFEPLS